MNEVVGQSKMSIDLRSAKDKNKVVAAVLAAVNAYMEEEQAAREAVVPERRPAPALSLWHVSGREEMMRMRQLWQRRIV